MRRPPVLLFLVALGLGPVSPAFAAAAAGPSSATAELTTCQSALLQADRALVAEGDMRTVPGAVTLRMRFDLKVRSAGRPRWSPVSGDTLGVWNSASPAPKRFTYAKRIEALSAPADYRMLIRFRWLDADGRRLGVAKRVTGACRQLDLRPDLTVLRIESRPASDPATRRYVVSVRNGGRGDAGAFVAGLSIGGVEQPPQAVSGLAAGQRRRLEFVAPACAPGAAVVATLDVADAVVERVETDNRLATPCPS